MCQLFTFSIIRLYRWREWTRICFFLQFRWVKDFRLSQGYFFFIFAVAFNVVDVVVFILIRFGFYSICNFLLVLQMFCAYYKLQCLNAKQHHRVTTEQIDRETQRDTASWLYAFGEVCLCISHCRAHFLRRVDDNAKKTAWHTDEVNSTAHHYIYKLLLQQKQVERTQRNNQKKNLKLAIIFLFHIQWIFR